MTSAGKQPDPNSLKQRVRKVLERTGVGRRALEVYGQYSRNRLARHHGAAKTFFTHVYQTNFWDDPESVSGPDSTVSYTAGLRQEVGRLLTSLHIRSIFDAPCGDFNWFRLIDLPPDTTYIGADIVEPLIARNNELYGTAQITFEVGDLCKDAFPHVDLWMCRNALFHLSYDDIYATLRSAEKADIPYCLITTHPRSPKNVDIPSGSYRLLNLEAAPFSFPQPVARIDDFAEGEEYRQMCLWTKEQVSEVLRRAVR